MLIFLWDCEWMDSRFRALLAGPDSDLRAGLLAKLTRQAKPDDVFQHPTVARIPAHGRMEDFPHGHQPL